MPNSSQCQTALLLRAKGGDLETRGRLLEMYRNYLRLLARTQIGSNLQVHLDASDLVQETLIKASRDFPQFNGTTEGQLMSWLRTILAHNLANLLKHHRAEKRDLNNRRSLEDELDRSSMRIGRVLAGNISSPSAQASRREHAVILADALAQLPDDYREVIVMRHLEDARFADIAAKMGRSSGAVRMLWVRALERLRAALEGLS